MPAMRSTAARTSGLSLAGTPLNGMLRASAIRRLPGGRAAEAANGSLDGRRAVEISGDVPAEDVEQQGGVRNRARERADHRSAR